MNKESIEQLLMEIDDFARMRNLSRREIAQKLNIPWNTFRAWFQKKSRKNPSPAYIEKIEKFLESREDTDTYWKELWIKILKWWDTQHQYSTVKDLAEEIGWDVKNLTNHLQNKEMPPKLVIEKIAKVIGIEISSLDSVIKEA